MAFKVIIQMD